MTLLIACTNCAASVSADYIADDDGARLFACCVCGEASVRFDFSRRVNGTSEVPALQPSPGRGGATDAAVWMTVAPLSFA
jgi:hypothetical protein